MASLPRRNLPPPMSTTASGSNNAVMPVTSPAFSLATNNRSKSWGSLAGSLVVKSFIVTLSNCCGLFDLHGSLSSSRVGRQTAALGLIPTVAHKPWPGDLGRDQILTATLKVEHSKFAGLREDKDARTVIKEHGGEG